MGDLFNLLDKGKTVEYNFQTGTTYTLTASDNGKIVSLLNAAAITLTVPQTSTEELPNGFNCGIVQRGAGLVTVAKEGTDVVESSGAALALGGQFSMATITKIIEGSPNTYELVGDIA